MLNIDNDRITSLKMPEGWSATLYEHDTSHPDRPR